MPHYDQLAAKLAERIVAGEFPPDSRMPSIRMFSAAEGAHRATVRHAYQQLADVGAVVLSPRRAPRVAPGGVTAARMILRGGTTFRLAGSDDPALNLLVGSVDSAVVAVGATGSYHGLSALTSGRADGAAMHLRHRDGEYNAPFVRGILAGRDAVLVHLWHREQGLLVPAGNPRGVGEIRDLAALRVARRPVGTGTRSLLDRMLLDAGIEPDTLSGPTVEFHLDVAVAVGTGEADAGLGLRSAANALGLDFVALVREPFQIATTLRGSGGLVELLDELADEATAQRIVALGGYDLAGGGEVIPIG